MEALFTVLLHPRSVEWKTGQEDLTGHLPKCYHRMPRSISFGKKYDTVVLRSRAFVVFTSGWPAAMTPAMQQLATIVKFVYHKQSF